MELGDMGLEAMRRAKETSDPNNIMNSGRIFPPYRRPPPEERGAAVSQGPLARDQMNWEI